MPIKRKKEAEEPPPYLSSPRSLSQTVNRFWGAMFCVALIVYAALLLIGRTEGFRDIVADRLEGSLGTPVTIGSSRITPTLHLLLEDVSCGVSATNETPVMEAKRVIMKARAGDFPRSAAWPIRDLAIEGGIFRFTASGKNAWSPLPELAGELHRWVVVAGRGVEIQDAAFSGLAWFLEHQVGLRISASDFVWRDQDGEVSAWIKRLDMRAQLIRPHEESSLWSRMRAEEVGSVWNPLLEGFELEWISLPDRVFVLKSKRSGETE